MPACTDPRIRQPVNGEHLELRRQGWVHVMGQVRMGRTTGGAYVDTRQHRFRLEGRHVIVMHCGAQADAIAPVTAIKRARLPTFPVHAGSLQLNPDMMAAAGGWPQGEEGGG